MRFSSGLNFHFCNLSFNFSENKGSAHLWIHPFFENVISLVMFDLTMILHGMISQHGQVAVRTRNFSEQKLSWISRIQGKFTKVYDAKKSAIAHLAHHQKFISLFMLVRFFSFFSPFFQTFSTKILDGKFIHMSPHQGYFGKGNSRRKKIIKEFIDITFIY